MMNIKVEWRKDEEDNGQRLKIPVRAYIRHCEIAGVTHTKMISRKIIIISGYMRVDGERMKDLEDAHNHLRTSIYITPDVKEPVAVKIPTEEPIQKAPEEQATHVKHSFRIFRKNKENTESIAEEPAQETPEPEEQETNGIKKKSFVDKILGRIFR